MKSRDGRVKPPALLIEVDDGCAGQRSSRGWVASARAGARVVDHFADAA
jgi:hypothetical protein